MSNTKSTWISLLRGINVGGKNIIKMKDLKADFESVGGADVRTYIQSGNVVFTCHGARPETISKKIADSVEGRRGFRPAVITLGLAQFKKAVRENPYPPDAEPKTVHFFFFSSPPGAPDLKRLTKLKNESEQFMLGQSAFFLFAPDGIAHSKLAMRVESCLGVPVTARNLRTVRKVQHIAETGPGP